MTLHWKSLAHGKQSARLTPILEIWIRKMNRVNAEGLHAYALFLFGCMSEIHCRTDEDARADAERRAREVLAAAVEKLGPARPA